MFYKNEAELALSALIFYESEQDWPCQLRCSMRVSFTSPVGPMSCQPHCSMRMGKAGPVNPDVRWKWAGLVPSALLLHLSDQDSVLLVVCSIWVNRAVLAALMFCEIVQGWSCQPYRSLTMSRAGPFPNQSGLTGPIRCTFSYSKQSAGQKLPAIIQFRDVTWYRTCTHCTWAPVCQRVSLPNLLFPYTVMCKLYAVNWDILTLPLALLTLSPGLYVLSVF
jgi:hypothetical protein